MPESVRAARSGRPNRRLNTRPNSRLNSRPNSRPNSRLKLCCALLSPLILAALLASNSPAQTRAGTAATASATTAAGESGTTGAITGRVVGEDGQPLSNARVITTRAGSAPVSASSALTDEEGKFALRNLTYGAYVVNAFAPGYMLEPDPSDQPATRVYHHVGDSVTLRMTRGGVITGTVTDGGGQPVVGVYVEAARVRYADGRATREGAGGRIFQPRLTDDRGVYRIYGLRPGAYIIRAGGRNAFGQFTPYDQNVSTYFPSATREGATQVSVQAGQETSGIDIRYRGEAGHAVSGTISGAPPATDPASGSGIVVALKHVSASTPEQFISYLPDGSAFVFDGVADGDYDLLARRDGLRDDFAAASPPRRVSVRGRDVTGVTLALAPLGSLSGQLLFDPAATPEDKSACQPARAPRAGESIVIARRDDADNAADQSFAFFPGTHSTAPGDTGEFQLRGLKAGRYQMLVRLPAADFYVRAITHGNAPAKSATPAPGAPVRSAKPAQAASVPARSGFSVQAGERLSGLKINVAAGASGLRGRVAAAAAAATNDTGDTGASSARLPPSRVHLVPAEREQADDALRYAESSVADDGTFNFANLAPGRYWVLARPDPAADSPDNFPRPLAWDTDLRARLRREAETANALVVLAPCQRIADFVLTNPAK
jgi:protocatechuate 3,4-dioxygenase beta subunit